jgi:hypothetical protein
MVAPAAFDKRPSDHSFDDAEALAWLRAQPGGRITGSAAALGREWGWNRMRAGRRLKTWAAEGYISRSRKTIVVTRPTSVTDAVTNVTALTKDVTPPVTSDVTVLTEGVTPAVTYDVTNGTPIGTFDPRRTGNWMVTRICTLVAALGLAAVSGMIAVEGLTTVFAGAFWPVVAIGIALEAGKLVATAWLRENWCVTSEVYERYCWQ